MSVPDRAEVRVVAMQDQRRCGNTWQCVAHVGLPDDLDHGPGHAGRRGTVARMIPPRAERFVVGYGGSDDAEHVEALLDGIRLDPDRRVWIGGAHLAAQR